MTSIEKELEELKLKHTPMMNEENIVKENLHTSETVENKQFPCHCGYQASRKRALKKHIMSKHKHKCTQCKYRFLSSEALNDHIKSKHTLTYPSTESKSNNKDTETDTVETKQFPSHPFVDT